MFKRLSINGEISRISIANMLRRVDAIFVCVWGAAFPGPSSESLSRLRLVRNMTLSYGLTVQLPEDPGAILDSISLEDASVIVVFLVAGLPSEEESGGDSVTGSGSSNEMLKTTLGRPEHRAKLLPVLLDASMRDYSDWDELLAGLLEGSEAPLDLTGDFADSQYLSASISRLCAAINQRIDIPTAKNPLRGISVDAPYVPSAYRRRSLMISSPALLAQLNDLRSDDVPTAELLPRIFQELGGETWLNNSNWCSEQPWECWHGLTVTEGLVTKLALPRNGLHGNYVLFTPSSQIITSGEIPLEICQLLGLRSLNLASNRIVGLIPLDISQLRFLRSLVLANNELEGDLPKEFGRLENLLELSLGSNRLSGSLSLDIASMQSLLVLDLSNNHISGTIPTAMSRLRTLRSLYLHGNDLIGT